MLQWPFEGTFVPKTHGGSVLHFALNGFAASEENIDDDKGWRMDDSRLQSKNFELRQATMNR